MADLAESITEDIQLAVADDTLELPILPEVALRIRDEAQSENVNAQSLAAVVSDDPSLAVQLVKVANSPMFRATRSIDDLSQAISRLGVENAANIVTGLAMQQMFQATTDIIDRKMRAVWKDATELAAWSATLSQRSASLRPDQATLAGLTHCIGVLPILSWAEENDTLLQDSLTLDRVIDSIHPTLGQMILKHWNFADELVEVPANYQREDYTPAAPNKPTYVDVVRAAHLLNENSDSSDAAWDASWCTSGTFQRLGLTLDDDSFAAELLTDVAEIKGVLG